MNKTPIFHFPNWPLKKKLFFYMMLLAGILLLSVLVGLFVFGRYTGTADSVYDSLDLQMEVFEKDILTHFDHVSAAGINLSEDITNLLEDYFRDNDLQFSELKDNENDIYGLQDKLIDMLTQKLLQEDSSGVFAVLDTTVNSNIEGSSDSRTGVYLQVNGYENANKNLLLYRGIPELAKQKGIMPHRKWRLEFQTDMFECYDELAVSTLPCDEAYRFSFLNRLPGTSEKAILLVCPIISSDEVFMGVCGFEISESYFTTHHAQPSKIPHLTCILSEGNNGSVNAGSSLSCGVSMDYYLAPTGSLTTSEMGHGLLRFTGAQVEYVGLKETAVISPNNLPYTLSVMILKSDYDNMLTKDIVQNIILLMLILFFTVNSCLYLSQRFISPIIKGIDEIKSEKQNPESNIPEISDLFEFLERKDMESEAVIEELTIQKDTIRRQADELRIEYEKTQNEHERALSEISRLAYSRKTEVDPDEYRLFKEGIRELTNTERKIFDYYLDGKNVKEILELAGIKESTLRFHNKNIYSKLGVNSLKQLLRYATLMKNE